MPLACRRGAPTSKWEASASLELPPSSVAFIVPLLSVPVSTKPVYQCSPYCIDEAGTSQTSLWTALQDATGGMSCSLALSEAINPQRSQNSKPFLYWNKNLNQSRTRTDLTEWTELNGRSHSSFYNAHTGDKRSWIRRLRFCMTFEGYHLPSLGKSLPPLALPGVSVVSEGSRIAHSPKKRVFTSPC